MKWNFLSLRLWEWRAQEEEAYVCIYSHRYADTILFYHEGGVDVGDVDAKALKLEVPVDSSVTAVEIEASLLNELPSAKKKWG